MEVTRGTAYGLAMSQMLIAVGVVLFFPPASVELYAAAPVMNGTGLVGLELRAQRLFLGLPLLASSALAVFFSTTTMGLGEQGVLGLDYRADVLEQAAMWDALFWAYAFLAHLLVAAALTTPADVYAVGLAVALSIYFLRRGCAPRAGELSITQENLSMLGYFLGVGLMAYCVPPGPASGARLTCLFILLVYDYFMALGHTWDREATLDTITNCRLFYVCGASFCLAGLYAFAVEGLG